MNRRRAFLLALTGFLLALGVSIGFLLLYYRPTIEYAYVDIVQKNPAGRSMVGPVAVALAFTGLGLGLWFKRRKGRQNG
jgi:hypothetical protein